MTKDMPLDPTAIDVDGLLIKGTILTEDKETGEIKAINIDNLLKPFFMSCNACPMNRQCSEFRESKDCVIERRLYAFILLDLHDNHDIDLQKNRYIISNFYDDLKSDLRIRHTESSFDIYGNLSEEENRRMVKEMINAKVKIKKSMLNSMKELGITPREKRLSVKSVTVKEEKKQVKEQTNLFIQVPENE